MEGVVRFVALGVFKNGKVKIVTKIAHIICHHFKLTKFKEILGEAIKNAVFLLRCRI